MVGGGPDAFIGAVHRKAASLDGHFDIVCGAFSRSYEKSKETGEALHLDQIACMSRTIKCLKKSLSCLKISGWMLFLL